MTSAHLFTHTFTPEKVPLATVLHQRRSTADLAQACFWFWRVREMDVRVRLVGEAEARAFDLDLTYTWDDYGNLSPLTLLTAGRSKFFRQQSVGEFSDLDLTVDVTFMDLGADQQEGAAPLHGWLPRYNVSISVSELNLIPATVDDEALGAVSFNAHDAVFDRDYSFSIPLMGPRYSEDPFNFGFVSASIQFTPTRYWTYGGRYDETTGAAR